MRVILRVVPVVEEMDGPYYAIIDLDEEFIHDELERRFSLVEQWGKIDSELAEARFKDRDCFYLASNIRYEQLIKAYGNAIEQLGDYDWIIEPELPALPVFDHYRSDLDSLCFTENFFWWEAVPHHGDGKFETVSLSRSVLAQWKEYLANQKQRAAQTKTSCARGTKKSGG